MDAFGGTEKMGATREKNEGEKRRFERILKHLIFFSVEDLEIHSRSGWDCSQEIMFSCDRPPDNAKTLYKYKVLLFSPGTSALNKTSFRSRQVNKPGILKPSQLRRCYLHGTGFLRHLMGRKPKKHHGGFTGYGERDGQQAC